MWGSSTVCLYQHYFFNISLMCLGPWRMKDCNVMSLKFNKVLTWQHSGEEDVVREGDKATFSQCEKYAVLICKLLPLLGNLLLIQVRIKKKKVVLKTFGMIQHRPYSFYSWPRCGFVCVWKPLCKSEAQWETGYAHNQKRTHSVLPHTLKAALVHSGCQYE